MTKKKPLETLFKKIVDTIERPNDRQLTLYLVSVPPKSGTVKIEYLTTIIEGDLRSIFKMDEAECDDIFNDPESAITHLQVGIRHPDGETLLDLEKNFSVFHETEEFLLDGHTIFLIEDGQQIPEACLSGVHTFVSVLVPDPHLNGTLTCVFVHQEFGSACDDDLVIGEIRTEVFTWKLVSAFPEDEYVEIDLTLH